MLRTNQAFLEYLKALYSRQEHQKEIVLKTFSKGEMLLVQDQVPSSIMLIKEGITKCYFVEENGKEYIVEFLGSGEIIGEIEQIKNMACLCSIETMTEVTAYSVAVPYFKTLIKTDLTLNNLLLDVFAERIINTSSRASYQQLYTKEHSLARLLSMQDKQGIRISKEEMAAYLGITVRSLNRILKTIA